MSAPTQVRSIFDRWQRLEADKKAIADDLKDLFAEAKGNGYEPKALRIAFRASAKTAEEIEADEELDSLVAGYMMAIFAEPEPVKRAPRAHPAPAHVEIIEEFNPETGEIIEDRASEAEQPSGLAGAAVEDAATAPAEPAADKGSATPIQRRCLSGLWRLISRSAL
jgi:uncharacterized protein (UPF0335 family)